MNARLTWTLALCLLALPGCGNGITPLRPEPAEPEPFVCDGETTPPEAESLSWKRMVALTNDLTSALELSSDTLCNELDVVPCADVHRTALGSNDPIGAARYEPVASPLATTPSAVDRLVLSACENAVERERSAAPLVFADLPPDDAIVDDTDAATATAIDAQITTLYRRLLARDPEPEEVDAVGELARDESGTPRSARELDVLACFAIGSTTEMVLY